MNALIIEDSWMLLAPACPVGWPVGGSSPTWELDAELILCVLICRGGQKLYLEVITCVLHL